MESLFQSHALDIVFLLIIPALFSLIFLFGNSKINSLFSEFRFSSYDGGALLYKLFILWLRIIRLVSWRISLIFIVGSFIALLTAMIPLSSTILYLLIALTVLSIYTLYATFIIAIAIYIKLKVSNKEET
jgi:hypothetical protein